MLIQHERIIPAQGYGYGAITQPDDTFRNALTGNLYATLGDRIFDVHPYCAHIGGYGIRWELDDHQKFEVRNTRPSTRW